MNEKKNKHLLHLIILQAFLLLQIFIFSVFLIHPEMHLGTFDLYFEESRIYNNVIQKLFFTYSFISLLLAFVLYIKRKKRSIYFCSVLIVFSLFSFLFGFFTTRGYEWYATHRQSSLSEINIILFCLIASFLLFRRSNNLCLGIINWTELIRKKYIKYLLLSIFILLSFLFIFFISHDYLWYSIGDQISLSNIIVSFCLIISSLLLYHSKSLSLDDVNKTKFIKKRDINIYVFLEFYVWLQIFLLIFHW